jgi:MFS family permease
MISDKIGRKPVLIIGYILFAVTAIGLSLITQFYVMVILFVTYGLFFALIDGVQRAFVVDLSPPDLKATALGTFHTATGLIALPGGVILGLIWENISPQAIFVFAAVLGLSSLILFIFVKEPKKINFINKF